MSYNRLYLVYEETKTYVFFARDNSKSCDMRFPYRVNKFISTLYSFDKLILITELDDNYENYILNKDYTEFII